MIGSILGGKRTGADKRQQFERLMHQTHRQAYNFAYRLTSNRAEADDLVQEAFIRAFRFFHRYREELPFTSWLFRIMTNVHIDTVRKRTRIRTVSLEQPGDDGLQTWEFADDDATTDSSTMESTLEEPLQMGLMAMTPEFRTAVVLCDVEGLSYEEVAEIMETSVGTVRSRIHRGRKQLRTYLEQTDCPGAEVYLQ